MNSRSLPELLCAPLALALLLFATFAEAQMDFSVCLNRLETVARSRGIQDSTIDTVFATVQPRPRVIEADRSQPEFVQTFAEYLGRRATERRIELGRQLYAEHRALLGRLTARYGVPGQYLVAFWGLETNYGGYLGNISVFDSLSTLACDARRAEYFTDEFVNALRVVDGGHISPDQMIGSWAGAMGQTQFMPSNYLQYAIDGDGDGRIDLWNSVPDALSSAANFLANLQWRSGQRWGREVLLPESFDYGVAGRENRRPLPDWRRIGITDVQGQTVPAIDEMRGALLVPAGQRGPAFLVYDNFDVIMRWNRSEFFALTVGHLADRIAGGGALVQTPPDERISRDDVLRVQRHLIDSGYDIGGVDGVLGPRSKAAIRELQRDLGMVPDGYLSNELISAIDGVPE